VATPTGDPVNMLLLATPILVLVGAAVVFCLLNDRRRARHGEPDYDKWDDDEVSPIEEPADTDGPAGR
jgi:sec-independent protein translocase protein TatC